MNTDKPVKNIHSGWPPWIGIAAITLAIIVISIACLYSGYFIIFQNLFYIPIVIACIHYTKRGFAFSVIVAGIYYCLILAFTRDPQVNLQAAVRTLIFVIVAGVVTRMAVTRKQAKEVLELALENMEQRVSERSDAVYLSNKKWQETFDAIGDAVWLLSPEGRILQSNKTAESMFFVKGRELFGRYCYEVVHGTDKPPPDCPLSRMLRSGHRESAEFFLGGSWMQVTVDPIYNTDGSLAGAVHIVVDISELKRAEEALARAKEAQYKALIENLPGKVFLKDKNLAYLFCNESYAKDLHIRSDEIAGKTDYDFFPAYLAEKYRKNDMEVISSGQAISVEEEYISKAKAEGTGERTVVNTVKSPVYDKDGSILGVLGFFWDVTARRQAEAEREKILKWQQDTNVLRQSLLSPSTLEHDLKRITDGIVQILDADFCRIWLIRPGDLCDKGCVHAEVREGPSVCRFREKCLHLMASSGCYAHINGKTQARVPFGCYKIGLIASGEEHRFLTNDVVNDLGVHDHEWARELGLVSFAGYQLKVSHGSTLGILALFAKHPILRVEDSLLDGLSTTAAFIIQRDIMENELRKVELIKTATEIKSKLTSMVSHELRSPLVAIREGVSLVEEGLVGSVNEKQKELLGIAKRNADRLGRLINDVLDMQKIGSGKLEFDMRENDINQTVLESVRDMSLLGKEKDLELTVSVDDDIPRMVFDGDRILQVLANLLSNAIKFTEKGSITVETRLENNMAHVIVRDTGYGIRGGEMHKLFLPFEQLDSTTSRKKGGSGLGLAISREIVEKHNGTIWVESEFGKGSEFHFTLPINNAGGAENG
jgi:PAS domain S-box-containing protein